MGIPRSDNHVANRFDPFPKIRAGCVLSVLACLLATTSARAETITLDQALSRAAERNPDLLAANADVEVGEGVLLGARKLPYNPELAARLGPAYGGGQTFFEYEVGINQTLELGGKRSDRIAGADARRRAAVARQQWARRVTGLRVRRAFFLALIARQRLESARDAEAVATELRAATLERRSLGAATQLDINVGTAAVGRAQADRMASERRYRAARLELAMLIGAPAQSDLEPEGQMPAFGRAPLDEDGFVRRALEREDLAAIDLDLKAAQADVALADDLAVPDVSLGVVAARDAVDNANAFLFGVSLPLPVLNRNQGGRATARGVLARTNTLADAARRQVEREARAVLRDYTLALDAVHGFDQNVVEKLGENLALARESFKAGKIGLFEFVVVRRDLVDTRVAYLDALAQLVESRFVIEVAYGGPVGGSR